MRDLLKLTTGSREGKDVRMDQTRMDRRVAEVKRKHWWGGVAQLVERSPIRHETLSSSSGTTTESGMGLHACTPSTWKVKAGSAAGQWHPGLLRQMEVSLCRTL